MKILPPTPLIGFKNNSKQKLGGLIFFFQRWLNFCVDQSLIKDIHTVNNDWMPLSILTPLEEEFLRKKKILGGRGK